MIELKNVSKVYGKRKSLFRALDDINLKIDDGASVAIVGKSGSGKSTLMHVMSGLDSVTSGEVIIDGVSMASMKRKTLDKFRAEKISFVFQSFFVQANESCAQNVALPLEINRVVGKTRSNRIKAALKAVGLEDKSRQKASTLSGGQKQRLAIARAIVTKPSILFADEPTGNLDSSTGETVEKLLFNLNKKLGCTLLIVTHDEELAAKCDTQVYIKDGSITKIQTARRTTK